MTCEVMAVEHISVQANGMYQSMRRGYADIVRLGLSMLRIGTIGFGGGNALIPVIEKEVVENGKLVTKREYDEDVVAACITPGALPVEIAAGIGQRLGGPAGMLVAASMMALPGALFTVLILAVLTGEQGRLCSASATSPSASARSSSACCWPMPSRRSAPCSRPAHGRSARCASR